MSPGFFQACDPGREMGGIRGHSVWETAPVFLILAVLIISALRNQPHGFTTALLLLAAIVLSYVIVRITRTMMFNSRRHTLERLRDLAALPDDAEHSREAGDIADRVIATHSDDYRLILRDMLSFLPAAKGSNAAASACRRVLFALQPWSREAERDIAAMRYHIAPEELASWLEWFINTQPGSPEGADRLADTAMYALPAIPEPERTPLIIRAISRAADSEAWKRFAKLFHAELAALDPSSLTSHQRDQLRRLLRLER
jgi:hypothetical protein